VTAIERDQELRLLDVLLEEELGRAPGSVRTAPPPRPRPSRLLAAALLLLGLGVVGGVLLLRSGAGNTAAPAIEQPLQQPQDPQQPKDPQQPDPTVAAPKDLAELRQLLAQVRKVTARCQYLSTMTSHSIAFAEDPLIVAEIDDAATLALWRSELLASTYTAANATAISASLALRFDLADGRMLGGGAIIAPKYSLSLGLAQQFEPTAELQGLLRHACRQAEQNGRRARGDVADIDELRALPATSRRVRCPCLTRDLAHAELPRFSALENLAFVRLGLCQLPHGDIVAAIAGLRTLRALSLPAGALDADDLRVLATLPLLTELELDGELTEPTAAALSSFAERVTVLRLGSVEVPLAALAAASKLVHLEELRITGPVPTELDLLASFPRLRHLELLSPGLGDHQLAALLATKIESLRLEGTKVTAGGLAQLAALPSLRELAVRDSDLDEVEALGKLQQLRRLDLTNTMVTVDGVRALQEALPSCTIVADPGVRHYSSILQQIMLRKF